MLLREKIPRDLPRDYQTLYQKCDIILKDCVDNLKVLRDDPVYKTPSVQKERIRHFKRCVATLELVESVGIAALSRAQQDDHNLNVLLYKITQEIKYPYLVPVVTTLSKQYFCIYMQLNLLCVPLVEGHFLLHLPDLYHELAHPLLVVRDDKKIAPFQQAMNLSLRDAFTYVDVQLKKERRSSSTPQYPTFMLQKWNSFWGQWMVEFFCDLYGAFTLGPAYAWAHLHLCIKRGQNPFNCNVDSHPADAARMIVILKAIEMTGFTQEAQTVKKKWIDYVNTTQLKPEAEYHRCYPNPLMESIVENAYQGVIDMGSRIAKPDTDDEVHTILNKAWDKFWADKVDYNAWEEKAIDQLYG